MSFLISLNLPNDRKIYTAISYIYVVLHSHVDIFGFIFLHFCFLLALVISEVKGIWSKVRKVQIFSFQRVNQAVDSECDFSPRCWISQFGVKLLSLCVCMYVDTYTHTHTTHIHTQTQTLKHTDMLSNTQRHTPPFKYSK